MCKASAQGPATRCVPAVNIEGDASLFQKVGKFAAITVDEPVVDDGARQRPVVH